MVGRKLDTKTFESVTKFFEAQFTTNKNNGMLECMELEHIKKRAHLKLKSELCNKICAHEDNCHTYRVKRKIASRCRPYNNREEQCWYIDRDCNLDHAYDNERRGAKHPRIKHPGHCDSLDNHCDNQPNNLDYEKPKSNSNVLHPIHSFLDKLAKHSWADCFKNLANQRKQALQSMVNAHHAKVDNRISAMMTTVQWSQTTRRLPTSKDLTVTQVSTTTMPS